MGGMFDAAAAAASGVQKATGSQDERTVKRKRPPRVIGPDGLVKPYSLWDAVGAGTLRKLDDGVFQYDAYVAHADVSDGARPMWAFFTDRRLVLLDITIMDRAVVALVVSWEDVLSAHPLPAQAGKGFGAGGLHVQYRSVKVSSFMGSSRTVAKEERVELYVKRAQEVERLVDAVAEARAIFEKRAATKRNAEARQKRDETIQIVGDRVVAARASTASSPQ